MTALEVTEDAISERIKSRSQEMRAFHQDLRRTLSPSTDWKKSKVGSHD